MPKPNYLRQHFDNPEFRDSLTRSRLFESQGRLALSYGYEPGDWSAVANFISGPRRWPVKWFPDANIAILPQTENIWAALRVAALGSSAGSTIFTEVVIYELSQWLNDPWRNKERAKDIRNALDENTWIKQWGVERATPLDVALITYTRLIGLQRSLACSTTDGTTVFGTNPLDKSKTMNAVKNRVGDRAIGLAKKGRDDVETAGVVKLSDEMHCLMAILYGLQNRHDTVVLTADVDYLEIFYKAQWFLDTHYRAWLAARMIADGKYGEPAIVLEQSENFFEGPLEIYRRYDAQLHEVLPPPLTPIRVGVVYVDKTSGTIHRITFPFEPQMLEMISTRGLTNGRCTDLFGDKNVHVHLGPLGSKTKILGLGLGKDVVHEFETNGAITSASILDMIHALNCLERFAR